MEYVAIVILVVFFIIEIISLTETGEFWFPWTPFIK